MIDGDFLSEKFSFKILSNALKHEFTRLRIFLQKVQKFRHQSSRDLAKIIQRVDTVANFFHGTTAATNQSIRTLRAFRQAQVLKPAHVQNFVAKKFDAVICHTPDNENIRG